MLPGCPTEFITDNASQFKKAIEWLKDKYGITNIQVSLYNSQASSIVENSHWGLCQSLYKATGGNPAKKNKIVVTMNLEGFGFFSSKLGTELTTQQEPVC
jgi:hypothetical protein